MYPSKLPELLADLSNLNKDLFFYGKPLPVFDSISHASLVREYLRQGFKIEGEDLSEYELESLRKINDDKKWEEHLRSQLAYIGITDPKDQEWIINNASLNGPMGQCLANMQTTLMRALPGCEISLRQEQERSYSQFIRQDDSSYLLKTRIVFEGAMVIDDAGTGITQHHQLDKDGKPIAGEPILFFECDIKIIRGKDGQFKAVLEKDSIQVFHELVAEVIDDIKAKIIQFHQLIQFIDSVLNKLNFYLETNTPKTLDESEQIPKHIRDLQSFRNDVIEFKNNCIQNSDKLWDKKKVFDPQIEGLRLYKGIKRFLDAQPVLKNFFDGELKVNERDFGHPNVPVIAARTLISERKSRILNIEVYGKHLESFGITNPAENPIHVVQKKYLEKSYLTKLIAKSANKLASDETDIVILSDISDAERLSLTETILKTNPNIRIIYANTHDTLESLWPKIIAKTINITVASDELARIHPELVNGKSVEFFVTNDSKVFRMVLNGYQIDNIKNLESHPLPHGDITIVDSDKVDLVDDVYDVSFNKNNNVLVFATRAGISGVSDQFKHVDLTESHEKLFDNVMVEVEHLANQHARQSYSPKPKTTRQPRLSPKITRLSETPVDFTYAKLDSESRDVQQYLDTQKIRFDISVGGFVEFTDAKWNDEKIKKSHQHFALHFNIHPDDLAKAWDKVLFPILNQYADHFKIARQSNLEARIKSIEETLQSLSDKSMLDAQDPNLPKHKAEVQAEELFERVKLLNEDLALCQPLQNSKQVTLYFLPGEEKIYQRLVYMIETELQKQGIRNGNFDNTERPLGQYTSLRYPKAQAPSTSQNLRTSQKAQEDPFKVVHQVVKNTQSALQAYIIEKTTRSPITTRISNALWAEDPALTQAKEIYKLLLDNASSPTLALVIIYTVLKYYDKDDIKLNITKHMGLDETSRDIDAARLIIKENIFLNIQKKYPEDVDRQTAFEIIEEQAKFLMREIVKAPNADVSTVLISINNIVSVAAKKFN